MNKPGLACFLLILSHIFWGYILFGQAEYMQFAAEYWTAALLVWMGVSTVIPAGLILAAAIGLGWGVEPVEFEEEGQGDPDPIFQTGQWYKYRTGRDIEFCPTYNDYLKAMRQPDDRDDWARREEERRENAPV
jgi:hypothetical protein